LSELRSRLAGALRIEFEHAQEQSQSRLREAIDPYSRFVRAEHLRWTDARGTLSALRDRAATFRDRLAA
jgi:hypothetical protein